MPPLSRQTHLDANNAESNARCNKIAHPPQNANIGIALSMAGWRGCENYNVCKWVGVCKQLCSGNMARFIIAALFSYLNRIPNAANKMLQPAMFRFGMCKDFYWRT
ncbi:hypothetical protein Zmor_009790 [Zophobas morio]|uniref:Uncharacterized protein n=1 Tax=Zophobas morio TaxID=2755281 RepID=A0AA38IMT5_9CUCU|nr:hypothetical protein Zmor_009790 [Zophobas morio]